jgi:two-component system response regulator CpxR
MRSILLIDDDAELCAVLKEYLTEYGCRVSTVHDGASGLHRALEDKHDLIVLDLMLPLLDGFEVLRQLRQRSSVPVILLSPRSSEQERIASFEHGADDYLMKPFAARELLARVRAVLRRTDHAGSSADTTPLHVGPMRLNPTTGEAWCGTRRLQLTATEFAILELLLRSAGRIVSRSEISGVLHQRQPTVYERSVDVHVSHVRRKLGSEAAPMIRTARGAGYMFVLPD